MDDEEIKYPDIKEISSDFKTEENLEYGKEEVEEKLWEKVERTGKKVSFIKDVVALYKYMMDSNVQWYRKSIVVGALIYFITPIDLIPDITPLVGYMDDLGVITAVLKYLGHEIIPYYD